MVQRMKETPRTRRKVTSSSKEVATNQLGNKVGVRKEGLLRTATPLSTADFLTEIYGRRERFSSTLDICFLGSAFAHDTVL